MLRKMLLGSLVLLFMMLATSIFQTEIALAQGGIEQAFGEKPVTNANGSKAFVWTAQQANSLTFRASPIFVCPTSPCQVGFMEAGFYKGIATLNNLTLYSSWETTTGVRDWERNIAPLSSNTWYNILVWYKSQTNPRWIVKLNEDQVFSPLRNIPDFSQGQRVGCGAEGGENDINIAVQCDQMQYRQTGGGSVWTLYDYTIARVTPDYCVFSPFQFGALGWGPC